MRKRKPKHKGTRSAILEISLRELVELEAIFAEFPRLLTFCAESELRLMLPFASERFWRVVRRLRCTNPSEITPSRVHLVREARPASPRF